MKRSTWLSKKLRFFNPATASRSAHLLIIWIALIGSGCQYLNRNPNDKKSQPATEEVEFQGLTFGANAPIFAHVSYTGCEKQVPHTWLVDLHTPFGTYRIKLDYSKYRAGEETLVIFNQHRFRAQLPLPTSEAQLAQICQNREQPHQPLVIVNPMEETRLKEILETISPNCNVELDPSGEFQCHLPQYEANVALRKLTQAHQKLVEQWQRHPYLLARRIAIARKLAYAINQPQSKEKLNNICRIVKYSIPDELPLVMRSTRWFDSVCVKTNEKQTEALLVSLYDAIREIESLTEELRSSSQLGLLSVRFPISSQNAPRDYWVTLKPVTIERATDDQIITIRKTACWHPAYDQSLAEHFIANELGLLTEPKTGSCSLLTQDDSEFYQITAVHYIKNSIASETEFSISNGRTKILRLPKGEYHYTIQSYDGPFTDFLFPRQNHATTSGILSWKTKRPHLTIREW